MDTPRDSQARILLMGCGSVGGVIAGGLLGSGYDLTILTKNSEITNAINRDGIHVKSSQGEGLVSAKAYTQLDEVQGVFDTVLLAMKATHVEQAARDVEKYFSPEGYVVTLQNGIVEDRIGEILGRGRVIGGLVGWGATMRTPGKYEMTSMGENVVGELDGRVTKRLRRLRTVLESAVSTNLSRNIYGVLWSKLAINCTITTLGAITGQLLGEMLKRWQIRQLALMITSEVVEVARSKRIELEPVGGTLEMDRLYLPPQRRTRTFGWDVLSRQIIMFVVGLKYRRLKSSMLQSLERGRRAEIEFMNGFVVEQGRKEGISTPINAALTTMVREIELGERSIHPNNLHELMHINS